MMIPNSDLATVVDQILKARRDVPAGRGVLVAITGIDGCGKGYVAARIGEALKAKDLRAANINIDGWLNLPVRRFSKSDPAGHFYRLAVRFDEMFAQLIFPLRDRRSLRIEADFTEETATEFRRQVYAYEDVDVILLEGIYLLKREFQAYYDLAYWVDCSEATALERAIARAQEELSPAATARAYWTIYFPAQEIHLERDEPRAAATSILKNDMRLGPTSAI
jgi:uridine kinase